MFSLQLNLYDQNHGNYAKYSEIFFQICHDMLNAHKLSLKKYLLWTSKPSNTDENNHLNTQQGNFLFIASEGRY